VRRFAWALGIVAVLMLVGTTAAALVVDDRAPGADPLVLRSGGVSVTVPGEHWQRWPTGTEERGLGFGPSRGDAKVWVATPLIYRYRACGEVTRAFVGTQPRAGRTPEQIADRWARWAAYDQRTGHLSRALLDADDRRADAVASFAPGRCNPTRVRISVVVQGEVAVVLVRDLDVPDALPDAEAEEILASVR